MIAYDISRKDQKQASTEANNRHNKNIKPDKETLELLYHDMSIEQLSKHFSVGLQTIYEWLDAHNIPKRTLSESTKNAKHRQYHDIQFSYEELDAVYDRSKSIDILASTLNVSRTHIRNQLKNQGIKIEPIEPSWRSRAEIELYEFLKSNFPNDAWENSNKAIISPFELDIINYDKKIAIEYCGLYWHSEMSSGKTIKYHRNKYIKCKEAGYKLITVFESDDQEKVRALLLKLFGKTTKIGARKTSMHDISSSEAMNFHKKHHLHSAVGSRYHYGLFYEDELVMAASFGKNRFGSDCEYECTRITSSGIVTVVGGVSKLIKHFIDTIKPKSIVTFADLRFGDGNVYKKCGFEYIEDTNPNYWYSRKYTGHLYSRVKFQKHKLESQLENFDLAKTEFENMSDNGWDRIWDCGNAKFVWHR